MQASLGRGRGGGFQGMQRCGEGASAGRPCSGSGSCCGSQDQSWGCGEWRGQGRASHGDRLSVWEGDPGGGGDWAGAGWPGRGLIFRRGSRQDVSMQTGITDSRLGAGREYGWLMVAFERPA